MTFFKTKSSLGKHAKKPIDRVISRVLKQNFETREQISKK